MFGSLQSYSYLLYSTKKKYCGRIGSTPSPNGVVHVQMGLVQLLLFSICFTPPSIYKAKYFLQKCSWCVRIQDLEILSLKLLLHIRTITQNCTRRYLGWVVGDYGTWFKDPLLRYFLDDKLVGVQELVTGRQGAAAGSQGSALPPVAAAASNCSPQSLPTCFTTCVGSLNRKPL